MAGSGQEKAVVNMYSTWVECAFRTVGLLVLQVPPDERDFSTPRHVPMRHLVTWLILFYFVVTTGYSAGLASVLTLPRFILHQSLLTAVCLTMLSVSCTISSRMTSGYLIGKEVEKLMT
jgi:hypothetical protein